MSAPHGSGRAAACARWRGSACSLSLALTSPVAAQGDSPAQAEIRNALTQWMADFNAGNADKVCGLFAPDLIAQYRGQPERDCECALRRLEAAR